MRTINTGTMRGTRVGAGPAGEPYGRGYTVAKVVVLYYCANGHRTTVPFISTVTVPPQWECGLLATRRDHPIDPPRQIVHRWRGTWAKKITWGRQEQALAREGDALMAESLAGATIQKSATSGPDPQAEGLMPGLEPFGPDLPGIQTSRHLSIVPACLEGQVHNVVPSPGR